MPADRDPRHRTEILADREYAAVRRASWHLDAKLVEWIRQGRRMSKLASIGDRIARKKAEHDRQADLWAARLNAVDEREKQAFAIAEAIVIEREADLSELESTVRTLSNLPLSDSGQSSTG